MHIAVIEDDEGMRGMLRMWMKETGSVVTGYSEPKTYDGIDIIVIGPNAEHIDLEQIEKRHVPFIRLGYGQDMDKVLLWVENMIKDIRGRAERSILEDRAV